MDIEHTSAMFFPSMRQESALGPRRVPPQSGQVPIVSIGLRTDACRRPSSELMMLLYMRGISPSYLAVFGQLAGGFLSFICGLLRKRSSSSGE